MKNRIVLAAAVSALALGVLVGCASTTVVASSEAEPVGVVTRHVDAGEVSGAALLEGTLAFENGCVRLDDGTVPVFADAAAKWDGTTLTWRGVEYRVGDKISFGGAILTDEQRKALVPDSCGAGQGWSVGTAGYGAK